MKKCLFCLVLILVLNQTVYSQSLNSLINKVSNIENVEKVKIGRFMMTFGKMFGGVSNMPVARGIYSMEVFDLSCCDLSFKKDLAQQISELKDGDGYKTLIKAKDNGDDVRIMMKKKKNTISDIVILCMNDDDPTIVKFSGKIKEKDIAELINKYDK